MEDDWLRQLEHFTGKSRLQLHLEGRITVMPFLNLTRDRVEETIESALSRTDTKEG